MSGYTTCACRDCFETVIGYAGATYCDECITAGCYEKPGAPNVECDSPHAYGGEEKPTKVS
jgi:hypothetical protein